MRKVLTLSGSIRHDSLNAHLARLMGKRLRALGAEVTDLSLGDFPLPLFNEDVEMEKGEPDAAIALADLFAAADAIFIATPEYNGSLTPLMKNTIDWISRQKSGPFKRATFGIGAVSNGRLSGVVALSHLRDILAKLGTLMAPTSLSVAFGHEGFDAEGDLVDKVQRSRADQLAEQLMTISRTRP
jgi:NAD(P)H-dependent FMN reductase